MKTKLTSVMYLGYTAMDRRFSNAMLPWLLRELKAAGVRDKLSIAVEDGCLKAYNSNFEPVIVHQLVDIIRASQVPGRPEELFYILYNEKEGLLNCYLFRTSTVLEVTDLFTQMREPSSGVPSPLGSTGSLGASVTRNIGFCNQNSTEQPPWASPAVSLPGNCNSNLTTEPQSALVRSNSNASVLTSLSADLSPSDSHFFEVLYIGKVRISQRKVPESLIDDALTKFAQHQAGKALKRRHSLLSSNGTSLYSINSRENLTDDKKTEASDSIKNIHQINLSPSTTPLEPNKNTWKSTETLSGRYETKEIDDEFDMFTKERVEKTVRSAETEKKVQRPTDIPLEPSVLILNVPKVNLGTVDEDEEKTSLKSIRKSDIETIISETATNITQFCSDATKSVSNEVIIKPENSFTLKDSYLSSDEKIDEHIHLFITEDHERPQLNIEVKDSVIKQDQKDTHTIKTFVTQNQHIKENISEKIINTECTESDKSKVFKENMVKFKGISQDSPKKINFEEITRKPKSDESERKGSMPENKPFLRDRSASIGTISHKTPIAQLVGEQNRTMLFQIGRSELRLISPDRKQILLHRAFKDVASCVLGRINKEHFGFVCRETNDSYACYVFQCESDSIATEVVNAIKQAFVAHAELLKKARDKSPNMTCEHCPMLWYHRLCHDVEGMNDKKSHAFILRRIEHLPEEEQDLIITKYQGGTNHIYETSEHNSFLMMLLRAHCEAKQTRHVHDTAENRSEFLNQYLGGSTIFMKAKRSISTGFDNLLKRRASQSDMGQSIVKKETSPVSSPAMDSTPEPELLQPQEIRSKSLSPAVISQDNGSLSSKHAMTPTQEEEEEDEEEGESEENKEEATVPVNSPMMDIFLQVSDNRPTATEGGSEPDYTWRHAIYQKVLQPQEEEGELSSNLLRKCSGPKGKRNKEELRQLWKLAIEQTVLLVRMEKENARLKEREESSAVRRIKLEYTELGVCDPGVVLMWDSLLTKDPSQPMAKVDRHMLTQAVMQGVPRMSRGAVWYFLAEQASLRAPPPDTRAHPYYSTPYRSLLAGLTKHQHAILIDLGRTFPKHSYFASALGPGQLALYNILKAYSLLDPDVGYCQGLSFVAGILLLHMDEAEAFILLRHLMFRRGLRKQYLPDMSALQVQLYQLSRLLRDHEPELHSKLEELDISPALYAAPWMLTIFTSQFPLGFVVRVFDLLFLESMDVIFSMALAILSAHKDGLMLCESCEEAAEYLKHKIPDMSPHTYRKIMKKVHALDISRQLSDYAVEYAVLREEMPRVAALTEENRTLTADKTRMTEELDSAMDSLTNFQKNQTRLETINKSIEQQLTLLSRYITAYHKQDLPPEIKKIVQNHSKRLSFSSKLFSTKFSTDDDEKRIPKTGISTPNLFAKITENKDIIRESPERERKVFIMKKSQSVHSGLIANLKPLKEEINELTESLRELGRNTEKESPKAKKHESFNTISKNELSESLKEPGKKNSGFIANTQEQIRQERLFEKQLKHDFDENLKKLDEKLSPTSYMDDLSIFQSRKCMSLNLNSKNESKTDSGFVTPLTPDKKMDSSSTISHPLSDVDVEIKFDGQSTKLKQIRPLKPCVDNKM